MNKKNTLIKSLALFVALFGAVTFGFGQSIFTNEITDPNPSITNPFTSGQIVDANITVSGIGRGSGILGSTAADRYNARNWSAGGIDVNDYFYFTITPNVGSKIDFISFTYTGRVSPTGPVSFAFRSSLDGYTSNIGTATFDGTTIDLSSAVYQNITSTITFRIYAWGSSGGAGTYSINDFTFNGFIGCTANTTWTAGAWDNGAPTTNTNAIIADNYDTNTHGDLSACSLTVNPGVVLNVANNTFVEIQNDVTVDGTLSVETHGNFVQNSDSSVFTNNGVAVVRKETAILGNWVDYTYWSSPVNGLTIGTGPLVDSDRRFWYDAANYFDGDSDGLDDDANDWQVAGNATSMTSGRGFAASHSQVGWVGSVAYNYNFVGEFNNGIITPPVYYNAANPLDHWNLLGNPYPSAISADDFFTANSGVIKESVYLWSHNSLIDSSNLGNESNNYNVADYAVINIASETSGSDGVTPNRFIPSGQGFFVSTQASGTVEFNNSMRTSDGTSNSQFFKNSYTKNTSSSSANKLWFNLTSNNGVYNQISVAYVDGATNDNDGSSYDAKRISKTYAFIYSLIDTDTDNKFIIQGKSPNSLNEDEMVSLGFDTNIDAPTIYTLSIAQLQGDFLTNNPVYLKDNVASTIHNLSDSDYTFTSDVGEFKDRFEIVFRNEALSNDTFDADTNALQIMQITDNQVRFSTSNNLSIKNVRIYDLLGRQLYNLNGNNREETYNLSNLNNTVFIAKVELSNGALITKKAIKK